MFNPLAEHCSMPASLRVVAVQWFLAFLGLTMVGFGLAFYALFRQDRQFPDFANIWHSFASMFSYMVSRMGLCQVCAFQQPSGWRSMPSTCITRGVDKLL